MVLRILCGVLALALAGAALALHAWGARVRALAVFDRPAFTWSRGFPAAFGVALGALGLAALACGAAAHPLLAAAVGLAFAGAPVLRRWSRSPARRARRLALEFAAFARGQAGADPAGVRARFVRRVRPAWGEEFAAQLAQDCADGEALARWIVKLDDAVPTRRAWAGLRPPGRGAPREPRD